MRKAFRQRFALRLNHFLPWPTFVTERKSWEQYHAARCQQYYWVSFVHHKHVYNREFSCKHFLLLISADRSRLFRKWFPERGATTPSANERKTRTSAYSRDFFQYFVVSQGIARGGGNSTKGSSISTKRVQFLSPNGTKVPKFGEVEQRNHYLLASNVEVRKWNSYEPFFRAIRRMVHIIFFEIDPGDFNLRSLYSREQL